MTPPGDATTTRLLAAPPVTMTPLVPPTPLPFIIPPGTVFDAPPVTITVVGGTPKAPKFTVPAGVPMMAERCGGIVTAPPGMKPGVSTPPGTVPGESCPPGMVPGESCPPTGPGESCPPTPPAAIVPPTGGTTLPLVCVLAVVVCPTTTVVVGVTTVVGAGTGGAAVAAFPNAPISTTNKALK